MCHFKAVVSYNKEKFKPVLFIKHTHTHTHTHTFNGPFSGNTQVSRYQKGRTNLDSTEARDSEWQWHQLGQMQVCILLQTDNHTSTPLLSFYRPDALPAAQSTASKHWRLYIKYNINSVHVHISKNDIKSSAITFEECLWYYFILQYLCVLMACCDCVLNLCWCHKSSINVTDSKLSYA